MKNLTVITALFPLLVLGCYDFSLPPRTDAAVDAKREDPEVGSTGTSKDPVKSGQNAGSGGAADLVGGASMDGGVKPSRPCNSTSCSSGCCDSQGVCRTLDAMDTAPVCGTNGNRCIQCSLKHAKSTCVDGRCAMDSCEEQETEKWGNCDEDDSNGCETNLLTSEEHCGECGNTCDRDYVKEGVCEEGKCVITCKDNHGNCDETAGNGCETDLLTSRAHCSGCGVPCRSPKSCKGGMCS